MSFAEYLVILDQGMTNLTHVGQSLTLDVVNRSVVLDFENRGRITMMYIQSIHRTHLITINRFYSLCQQYIGMEIMA